VHYHPIAIPCVYLVCQRVQPFCAQRHPCQVNEHHLGCLIGHFGSQLGGDLLYITLCAARRQLQRLIQRLKPWGVGGTRKFKQIWVLPSPILRGMSSSSGSSAARPPLLRCAPEGAATPREAHENTSGEACPLVGSAGRLQVARSRDAGTKMPCGIPLRKREKTPPLSKGSVR